MESSQRSWRHLPSLVGNELNRIARDLPSDTRKKLYCALVQPHVDYCCVVWDAALSIWRVRLKLSKIGAWDLFSVRLGALQEQSWGRSWSGQLCPKGENFWPSKQFINVSTKEPPPSSMTNSSRTVIWVIPDPEEPLNYISSALELRSLLNTQVLGYGIPSRGSEKLRISVSVFKSVCPTHEILWIILLFFLLLVYIYSVYVLFYSLCSY